MVYVYHQVSRKRLDDIRHDGLVQFPAGERREGTIAVVDALLNDVRPERWTVAGVDRERNIYGYLAVGDKLVDIRTGKTLSPHEVIEPGQVLVRIAVDPLCCYVSDLDMYDKIKELVEADEHKRALQLAQRYWAAVQPLDTYDSAFSRREVMITYDVPANMIEAL